MHIQTQSKQKFRPVFGYPILTSLFLVASLTLTSCYSSDGDDDNSEDTEPDSPELSTVTVDLDNLSEINFVSTGLITDSENIAENFGDDIRIIRYLNDSKFIEVKASGNVKSIHFSGHYENNISDKTAFSIQISEDGGTFSDVPYTPVVGRTSDFVTEYIATIEDLDQGVDYFRIVFPVLNGNDTTPWNPQIASLSYEVELDPSVADNDVIKQDTQITGGKTQAEAMVPASIQSSTYNSFDSYVYRGVELDSGRLLDGTEEFRFVSFNMPELHINETPYWSRSSQFQMEDALKSIADMGGKVVRIYVPSVENSNSGGPYHITFNNDNSLEFNETLFADLDLLLDLANKHGVRLIIPFVDHWSWWGGVTELTANRSASFYEFYTDEEVKSDYKEIVNYLLNRVNTISGVAYNDDPAIFAWET